MRLLIFLGVVVLAIVASVVGSFLTGWQESIHNKEGEDNASEDTR